MIITRESYKKYSSKRGFMGKNVLNSERSKKEKCYKKKLYIKKQKNETQVCEPYDQSHQSNIFKNTTMN